MYRFFIAALFALPLAAQDGLSLQDAVRAALVGNPSIRAASSAEKAAAMRITEARSGQLPKVGYAESWTRSDNPVFVFGSLLEQHQFTSNNFDLGSLNRPGFLDNFQSRITADQVIYDGGQTRHAVRSAQIGRDLSAENSRRAAMRVIAGVIRAYYYCLSGDEEVALAAQAERSAAADLERAQSLREAGMSTDADVLSIRVHLAGVREQRIRHEADVQVARAALNDALGLPLGTRHTLTTAMTPIAPEGSVDRESQAMEQRPEMRGAKLALALAENQVSAAHGAYMPQVTLHAGFEADRQRFVYRAGANWLVGADVHWNLFNGGADKARSEEGRYIAEQSAAEREHAASAIRLEVRRAQADLQAATQRIEVAAASIDLAQESLRITRNRYEAGITNVTDLLRTETALLEAQTRRLAAVRDQRLSAAMLDLATGTLSPEGVSLQ